MKTLTLFVTFLIFYAHGEIDLNNLEVPEVDIDDFAVIKEKCNKAGDSKAYEKLKASKESLQTCIVQFANITAVKDEIEEAKKTGSMDEVFGKYCGKRPKLATCIQTFTDSLRPCLNTEENKALNITLDILKQLGDFVCYRDGDRIAMFIAEGGVECIQSHIEGIKNCVNATFKIEPTTVNTNSLPNLLMDKKKCDDLGKLQNCVVEELEKCKDSTPANIVDALFKFIKRSACTNKQKRSVEIHRIFKRSVALTTNILDPTEAKNNFFNVFKEKCAKNAPEGGYEEFTLTFESATHCIRNKTRDEPIFVTPVINYKENVQRCVNKLLETTEACLSEEEKYWPKFYLQGIENFIDTLYKNKDIMTKGSRVEFANCFQNFKPLKARQELAKCFEFPEINSLKKDVVCSKLTNASNCVTEQIKKRCISDVDIFSFIDDILNSFKAPCAEKISKL